MTAAAPWLPPAFDAVIATAMAKEPAARYPSAQALAAAAQAALRTLTAAPDPAAATQQSATVSPPHHRYGPASPPAAPGWPPAAAAPTGYPPHYGAPGGPRRASRTKLVAGAIVVALLAAGITAIVMSRTNNGSAPTAAPSATSTPPAATAAPASPVPPPPAPTTTPPPAPVDDADLPTLLLPPDQLSALLGANPAPSPPASGIANDAATVTPTQCISALLPMQRLALDNTGFRAGYSQQFTPSTPTDPRASQGVVAFPSPEMAAAFITREKQLWAPCGNQVLTLSGNGSPERSYQLAAPSETGDVLTINATRLGAPLQCQHALTARSNVVIDVTTCLSSAVTDQAVKITRAIAARIK
ncbi:sensor domain-containing protein (plasmid) [Mycolicibacterium aichiense]|uniref:sensor domain-containing protein n=1 Tax=Mycolicibacterium aichiense TaxID=1799 RepID=UPI003D67AA58